jgi:hypothetical protein
MIIINKSNQIIFIDLIIQTKDYQLPVYALEWSIVKMTYVWGEFNVWLSLTLSHWASSFNINAGLIWYITCTRLNV